MASKKHVTALGVPFDMAAFRAKNEKVRAVGNMNVNARGDILDSNNNIIDNRNKIINRMYEKTLQSNIGKQGKTKKTETSKISDSETNVKELNDLDDDLPNPTK